MPRADLALARAVAARRLLAARQFGSDMDLASDFSRMSTQAAIMAAADSYDPSYTHSVATGAAYRAQAATWGPYGAYGWGMGR